MLSCICLGLGEAAILTAIAGSVGLAAHSGAPNDPTCCNHLHVGPARPTLTSATRLSAIIAIFLAAAYVGATCAAVHAPNHDHTPEDDLHFHDDWGHAD